MEIMKRKKRALFLSAHADDAEIWCGATIHKFKKQGYLVYHHIFSICKEATPEGYDKNIRMEEAKKSGSILKIDRIKISDIPVRRFEQYRQNILEKLIEINKEFKPNIVFTHSNNDLHQDHNVLSDESSRAFKYNSMFGYRGMSSNKFNVPLMYSRLRPEDLHAKIKALECYGSQSYREYIKKEFIVSSAIVNGIHANTKYAEAFEVMRYII